MYSENENWFQCGYDVNCKSPFFNVRYNLFIFESTNNSILPLEVILTSLFYCVICIPYSVPLRLIETKRENFGKHNSTIHWSGNSKHIHTVKVLCCKNFSFLLSEYLLLLLYSTREWNVQQMKHAFSCWTSILF